MRTPVAGIAVVIAAGLAAGVAWATIPDGSGTIHACYSTSDKSLRVVDSGSCNNGEAPIGWNENATQGPQGPQGQQGQPGDTGPQGLPGLTYATSVDAEVVEDPVIGGFFEELSCPSGTKALQGTYEWEYLVGSTPPQADVESLPSGDDSWIFAAGDNSTYKGVRLFVFLSCVYAR